MRELSRAADRIGRVGAAVELLREDHADIETPVPEASAATGTRALDARLHRAGRLARACTDFGRCDSR